MLLNLYDESRFMRYIPVFDTLILRYKGPRVL